MDFNSQPHKEADDWQAQQSATAHHFNSQPHKEADIHWILKMFSFLYFNSQPHKEADRENSGSMPKS